MDNTISNIHISTPNTISINLFTGIDDAVVSKIVAEIRQNSSEKTEKIILNISSGGGSVFSAVSLYNFLKDQPCQVHTHNYGEVSSSAILPFLAGSIRTSSNNAKFLFHTLSYHFNGDFARPKIQEVLHMVEADEINYASIVRKELPFFCNQYNIDEIVDHGDLVLLPRQAFELGLLTDFSE